MALVGLAGAGFGTPWQRAHHQLKRPGTRERRADPSPGVRAEPQMVFSRRVQALGTRAFLLLQRTAPQRVVWASCPRGKPKRSELRRWRRQEQAKASAKCEEDCDEQGAQVKRNWGKEHFARSPRHFR